MKLFIKSQSETTGGTLMTTTDTFESISEAQEALKEIIFDLGCTVIDPVITDETGKRYHITIAISGAV